MSLEEAVERNEAPPVVLVQFDEGVLKDPETRKGVMDQLDRVIPIAPTCQTRWCGSKRFHVWQVPLELAFAQTVHSMQGESLDYVVTNPASTFDMGQLYVALTRARRYDGLGLLTLPTVKHFTRKPNVLAMAKLEMVRLRGVATAFQRAGECDMRDADPTQQPPRPSDAGNQTKKRTRDDSTDEPASKSTRRNSAQSTSSPGRPEVEPNTDLARVGFRWSSNSCHIDSLIEVLAHAYRLLQRQPAVTPGDDSLATLIRMRLSGAVSAHVAQPVVKRVWQRMFNDYWRLRPEQWQVSPAYGAFMPMDRWYEASPKFGLPVELRIRVQHEGTCPRCGASARHVEDRMAFEPEAAVRDSWSEFLHACLTPPHDGPCGRRGDRASPPGVCQTCFQAEVEWNSGQYAQMPDILIMSWCAYIDRQGPGADLSHLPTEIEHVPGGPTATYTLAGVLVNRHNMHFVARLRDSDQRWYLYDDRQNDGRWVQERDLALRHGECLNSLVYVRKNV